MDSPTAMSTLLSSIAEIVTAIMGWVVDVCDVIVSQPLLLLTVGFLMIGGAIGIFGRLLSRN